MLPKNWGEPKGAPAIFEKQIEIKLLHPASTLESRIQVLFAKTAAHSSRSPPEAHHFVPALDKGRALPSSCAVMESQIQVLIKPLQ
ncbi:MAG: hypothetical protein P8X74_01635 [Reinekea sp.]